MVKRPKTKENKKDQKTVVIINDLYKFFLIMRVLYLFQYIMIAVQLSGDFQNLIVGLLQTATIALCYQIVCCRLRGRNVERFKVCVVWICYFGFEQKLNKHYQNQTQVNRIKKFPRNKKDMIIYDNSKFWLTRL